MNTKDLYYSRYEKFKVEGLNEYIDNLIESEVFSRDINNLEELYVFLDILELKLQDKIAKRIGTFNQIRRNSPSSP